MPLICYYRRPGLEPRVKRRKPVAEGWQGGQDSARNSATIGLPDTSAHSSPVAKTDALSPATQSADTVRITSPTERPTSPTNRQRIDDHITAPVPKPGGANALLRVGAGIDAGNDVVCQPLNSGESSMDVDQPSTQSSAETHPSANGRPVQPASAPICLIQASQSSVGGGSSEPSSSSSQAVSNVVVSPPSDNQHQPSGATPTATYRSTAIGTHPSCTIFSDAAVSTDERPGSTPPGADPRVLEYIENLGLSADVAGKLELAGLKNIKMIRAMKDVLSDSRKDKLEEELQTRAGLSFLEAVVFVSGLRRPGADKP